MRARKSSQRKIIMREVLMSKDYYNDLRIDKNASPDEIKKAYRKLAL